MTAITRRLKHVRESVPMAVEQGTSSERVLEARERYVARGIATPPIVVARAEGARVEDVDGQELHRLRRRPGLPEHGSWLPACRGRDARADRHLPPPVLHGRHLRAVHRGLPPTLGALPMLGRGPEEPPAVERCGGCRKRGQDRARSNWPARRRGLRERVPWPHAPDDDDDAQGDVQARTSARSRPRSTARPAPIRTAECPRTTPSKRSQPCSSSTRSRASSWNRSRARAASSSCPRTSPVGSGTSAPSRASCTWTTRCNREWAAPDRSGRSSTTAWSRTCSSRASRSVAASLWRR